MQNFNLTERERQNLAQSDRLNAILSQSSIKEGAEAAQVRAREQAAMRLQLQKEMASRAESEAALGVRSQEGALDRAAAMARTKELTGAQRDQMAALAGAGNLAGDIAADIEQLPGGGDELGGIVGAGQWVLERVGINPLTNLYKESFVSLPVQQLQAKAAGLYTQAVQSMQKGVLSDQDFKRVEALNITDPSLDKNQLITRISAVNQIMANTRAALPGAAAPATAAQPAGLSSKALGYLE